MSGKRSEIMDKLTSLAKQRGFIFQSSEIYGGLGSTWDYGHLGVELKRNIKNRWWRDIVTARQDVVGMDAAILMHPKVWEASGHVEKFHDLMVANRNNKKRYRLDHLLEAQETDVVSGLHEAVLGTALEGEADTHAITAIVDGIVMDDKGLDLNQFGILADGKKADWTVPRQFNLMFKTFIGPTDEETNRAYLRPETAQGIFVNFLNVQAAARAKLPFGIAQMGKAFRNEITTGNFIFRTREFEQMEMEFFVRPEKTAEWLEYWSNARLEWYQSLGIRPEKLCLRPHGEDELAHYSSACYDVEYEFPFGWSELEGIADRGTYDLDQHQAYSGKKITYFDTQANQHIVPAVVEASAGVDRTILTVLSDAYHEEQVKGETRVVLRLNPVLAPITVAVFPLVNKEGMPELARRLVDDLQGDFAAFYDAGGSIGRRYRRQDEAGTPFGLTIDGQTLEDQTVTIRDRDTMEQERVSIDQVKACLREKLAL
ncbi:MAG: glycine--tRNA ligase [Candidatus Marinimicrobia bacterium]|nr:glycine--tRNA ligase [Candidatus Neomarinimicrobiota bacterium]